MLSKGFKQKTYKELIQQKELKRKAKFAQIKAKKKVKKPKVATITKLKKDLWEECKRIVRKKYIQDNGTWNCFTCGRLIDEPFKAHTAHFIPSASCGAYLRYDMRNLRVCCYFCNVNLGGNGSFYYKNLVTEKGQEYVDQLFVDKQKHIKADTHWYIQKIEEYKKL